MSAHESSNLIDKECTDNNNMHTNDPILTPLFNDMFTNSNTQHSFQNMPITCSNETVDNHYSNVPQIINHNVPNQLLNLPLVVNQPMPYQLPINLNITIGQNGKSHSIIACNDIDVDKHNTHVKKEAALAPSLQYTPAFTQTETFSMSTVNQNRTDNENSESNENSTQILDRNLEIAEPEVDGQSSNTPVVSHERPSVQEEDSCVDEDTDYETDDSSDDAQEINTPTVVYERRQNIKICANGKNSKLGRYFVAAEIQKVPTAILLDTGAEISVAPPEYRNMGKLTKLREPIYVKGFSGTEREKCTEKVRLKLDLGTAKYIITFYICNTSHVIIGSDLLRNRDSKLSINTRTCRVRIGESSYYMDPDEDDAIRSLDRRQNSNERRGRDHDDVVRTMNPITVPAFDFAYLEVRVKTYQNESMVFLSDSDDNDMTSQLYMPSGLVQPKNRRFRIQVHNRSNKDICMKSNARVGRICQQSHKPTKGAVCCYTINEVKSTLEEMKTGQKFSPEVASNSTVEPVKLEDIVNRDKIDDETLERMRATGVECSPSLEMTDPEAIVPDLDWDYQTEKNESKNSPYWKNEKELLTKFTYDTMNKEDENVMRDNLKSYKKVFMDESQPSQFHEGIRINPIKIKISADAPQPAKDPVRRMNPTKLHYLKEHIEKMNKLDIIAELDRPAVYTSPVHIVIEERYVAAKKGVITKTRFVLDMRHICKVTETVSYPLPLVDQFRAEVASGEFKVFSNFDLASGFYQIPLETESAKRLFAFMALGRMYYMKRLSMGNKSSPALMQQIVEKIFKKHENVKGFIDDLTVRSRNMHEHVHKDIPKFLAICSRYNLLLKPEKTELAVPYARILGFKVSQQSTSLSIEKADKIKKMAFPADKKQAISHAAFFSYFLPLSPKLTDLMEPLRRLARPKDKFAPKAGDVEKFEAMKTHLLDPNVGAIRTPSARKQDTMIVWTDASTTSISGLVTQMLPPLPTSELAPDRKYMTIVACWSKQIDRNWSSHPIWLLELLALQETTRKFKHLLAARKFVVMTDSKTVKYWASLDRIPMDLARKVMNLQEFDFDIMFIESRANAADWLSRLEGQGHEPTHKRTLGNRIVNSKGESIDWQKLFSTRKCNDTIKFFTSKRHQKLSRPLTDLEQMAEASDDSDDDDDTDIIHEKSKTDDVKSVQLGGITTCTVHALGLDDDELEEGLQDTEGDLPLDDNACAIDLPTYDEHRLERVKALQGNDEIKKMITIIKNDEASPSKAEALGMNDTMKKFYHQRSTFRVTAQNILIRCWLEKNNTVTPLIVVANEDYKKLVHECHSGESSLNRHFGQSKTLTVLSKRYFTFGARKIIQKIISGCEICRLNQYPRTNAETQGNQIATRPNEIGLTDLVGPLHGFAQTAAGNPRYVFVYVDAHSRYIFAKPLTSTADDQITSAFADLRTTLCGFPEKIIMDNAIARNESQSWKFLKEHGVRILHGMPHVSRCQAKCERAIGTFTRTLCKLQTQYPRMSFERLTKESAMTMNSTPSDGLEPGKSPKDLHFTAPPSNFLQHENMRESKDYVQMAKQTSRDTLLHDIRRFLKKPSTSSPTDNSAKLRVDDLCLKKRTVFPTNSPKKLAYKVIIDAFKIKSRVATNAYVCESLITKNKLTLPGDQLIKLRGLNEEETIQLVRRMEDAATRERTATTAGGMRTRSGRQINMFAIMHNETNNGYEVELELNHLFGPE